MKHSEKNIRNILILFIFISNLINAQQSLEIYPIDSYVTPEKPYILNVSFYTSDSAVSKIIIEDEYEFIISEKLTDFHEYNLNLSSYKFDSAYISYKLIVENKEKGIYGSEVFEEELPHKNLIKSKDDYSLLGSFCVGSGIFSIPSIAFAKFENGEYFGLTKEFPFLSYYASGYNYPSGYLSIEYTYYFDRDDRPSNFLRFGYKHIVPLPVIEFISGGVTGFTDFKGFNGVSPEVTIGFFEFYDAFTLYGRYRYSIQPSENKKDYHEISAGIYTNFFSLNL